MSHQHYALISKYQTPPLKLEDDDNENNNNNDDDDDDVREELVKIYETFADLYPNPKLTAERRQRDTLLQAARAASTFQQQQQHTSKRKKRTGGFLSFLFGGRNEVVGDNDQLDHQQSQTSTTTVSGDDNLGDAALLSYIETPNPLDDGQLCDTQRSIDTSCIPEEVYSVARFHLSSTKSRRIHPNILRGGSGSDDLPIYIVVGLGKIAVFDTDSYHVMTTSDHEELQGYAEKSNEFATHSVRGAVVSRNCIAISWGFLDGLTVFYRRVQVPNYLDGNGWEAVWTVGPSPPVLENMPDLFHDDQDQPGSPLLRISDCVPLTVDVGQTNDSSEEEEELNRVCTLAISRLGGYIELIPIPTRLWAGHVLTLDNFRPPKHKMRKNNTVSPNNKRKRPQQHYALGKNIACPPQTIALTTIDYHIDVQAMEAYRTSVNSETAWNDQAFPDAPPAEFVLAASGVARDGTNDTITFWTVSTLFADSPTPNDDIGFSLHSRLIEAVTVQTGSPVSVFASPRIMEQWRMPRQVELKENAALNNGHVRVTNPTTMNITTLSTSAPVVTMRFSESDGSTSSHSGPFLSVLDWNGGVQIFNCSILGRVATQNMPLHEYEAYQNSIQEGQNFVPFSLVTTMISRSHFPGILHDLDTSSVANLQWMGSREFGTAGTLPPLALIMEKMRTLGLLTFTIQTKDDNDDDVSLEPSLLSLPFPSSGAAIKSSGGSNLSFVALHRGKSNASGRQTRLLTHFVMEQLQPIAIVESLARESKFKEAIESASKLSADDQTAVADVVAQCLRKLWETKRDMASLEATGDTSYIIQQALLIRDKDFDIDSLTMETLHPLLKLALACCERSKDNTNVEIIRDMVVRLGSYELLCHVFGSNPSLRQFLREFLMVNVVKLAEQLARRADVRVLSMLFFRHRKEIRPKILSVLSLFPPSLDPMSYCHLLPVIRNGSYSDYILSSQFGIATIPWSHMPQYLSETEGYTLVLSLLDEKAVLDYNKGCNSVICTNTQSLESVVADWFLSRAKLMQTFVGDIDCVIRLCELGLMCLTATPPNANFDDANVAVKEVHKALQSAISLQRMILDEIVSIDVDGIDADDLMDMNLTQLLDLVLNLETDPSKIMYRFKEYIQPLILRESKEEEVDLALAAYCAGEASKCQDSPVAAVKMALASCAAIAECSKTTIPKQDRLIKEPQILIEMVIKSSSELLDALSIQPVVPKDQEEILQGLWRLYETLPSRLAEAESGNDLIIKSFYKKLVFIDILTRWPGCRALSMVHNLGNSESLMDYSLSEYEKGIIDVMCKSFFDTLTRLANDQDKVSLLEDLLSDVEMLSNVCFEGSSDIATTICMSITPQLLNEGDWDLIATYLRWNGPSVDSATVQRMVIDLVDDAVFSELIDGDKISRSIQCQDILGPLLPKARGRLHSMRRYLDASHFISTVLFDGKNVRQISPLEIKELSGLDCIETVLQLVPESVLCGSVQWMDEVFAVEANRALRRACGSNDALVTESSNGAVPPLPGGAIFHLATILALEDSVAVVAVKCRFIHYAVKCGFHGAAAAVGRTLISAEQKDLQSSNAVILAKLDAIAEVVSEEVYQDLTTKKELCDKALGHLGASLSATASNAFSVILQASSALDVATSRFNQEFRELPRERKEELLSRPLARLYKHIFYEYNSDVYLLFLDLTKQVEQQQVHDSLMNALSRFVFYWCIHDSKTLKSVVDLWEVADAHDNLALGCSLLLQIPSKLTATNCVRELQKIAADQAANVETEERFGRVSLVDPDKHLVRRLVDRGYSENAARRAVVMTGNSGYNEALGWAVMHTMDPDFNEPLAITKAANKLYIDEDSIQLLQKSLFQVSKVLEDPSSRLALLRHIANQYQEAGSSDNTIETTSRTEHAPGKHTAAELPQDISKKKQTVTPPPSARGRTTNGVPSATSRLAKQIIASTPSKPFAPAVRVSGTNVSGAGSVSMPKEKSLQMPGSLIKTNERSSQTQVDAKIVVRDAGPSKATQSDLDRDELRKRGQAALVKLRGTTQESNRRRLIEEGRLLLKQSRSGTLAAKKTATKVIGNGKVDSVPPPPAAPSRPDVGSSPESAPSIPKPPPRSATLTTSKPKPAPRGIGIKVLKDDPAETGADDGWDFDDF
ncbi:hypothetical protein IV203_001000 [Nitzschia inconspicua]|uniref:UBA domain-containing protein n=1 Tax=Nitzschia inconspicua TaxID=303405 RepID=A0A9K3L5Z7_9STRA|nr:hypothetical protein IV203_001000 [Nitzschia inconspicua]